MRNLYLYGAVGALCLSLPVGAVAEGIPDIVITPLRTETSLADVLAPTVVLTRKQIERSGASTLPQALALIGGVQVNSLYGAGLRANISLRGFGDNAVSNTLVLVDGRPLNNSDLGGIDWGAVPLGDVQRIEVIQGGAGVLYGDQAVGGVINIITRKPLRAGGSVTVTRGSYGKERILGTLQNRLSNGFSYALTAKQARADNYRANNASDQHDYRARLGYDYAGGRVFGSFQRSHEVLGLPGGLFASQVAANPRQTTHPNDFADTKISSMNLGWRQSLSDFWNLAVDFDRRTSRGYGSLSGSSFSQRRDYRSLSPRMVYATPDGAQLIFGMDLRNDRYHFKSSYGVTQSHQRLSAGYLQAGVPLAGHLRLNVGARAAEADNHVIDSNSFSSGHNFSNVATAGDLGLAWQATHAVRLYARVAQVYRFPKVDELTDTATGSAGLATQTGNSYEAGAKWARDGRELALDVYRLNLHNEIAYDPSAGTYGANVNLDRTRRTGLRLSAATPLSPRWRLHAAYAWTDAHFGSGTFDGNEVPLVARNTLKADLSWLPRSGLSLTATLRARDGSYAAGDFANALVPLPGGTVVDLSGRYAWRSWIFSGRIGNLFDRRYSAYAAKGYNPVQGYAAETAYYPAPRRNLSLSASYRF
ncbi:MAG: TonB-dependent receptor [Acidihalobacter sp.]|uniref:TonB-dependent receptor family protein n=1 Tax=Acidihalobacter sp. TaxID=1872108 RepID=UPI00307FBC48